MYGMRFAFIVSTAALVTVTNGATCDLASLQTLLTSSAATTCKTDSGFRGTTLATPTDAELAKMCSSEACMSLLSEAESAAPSECTVGTFALYGDLITPLTKVCAGGSSTGSSATTGTVGSTAGSSTSATVTASSTGSTGSSSLSDASASASASGSSDANMAAVSVGAVLAAVAATFF